MNKLITRLRSEALARGAELDFDDEGAEVVAADHLCMVAAKEIERLTRELEKAREALASAYQAAGVLVMPEDDKRPSDKDQTELLDLLSRWEAMTKEQIEAFLPWPKDWTPSSADDDA